MELRCKWKDFLADLLHAYDEEQPDGERGSIKYVDRQRISCRKVSSLLDLVLLVLLSVSTVLVIV